MRVATWNVNSIRARQHRVLEWVERVRPDVLCLQEIKVADEAFPGIELAALGYQLAIYGQKTYNGVAIASRLPMTDVVRGMDDGDPDDHARLLAVTISAGDLGARAREREPGGTTQEPAERSGAGVPRAAGSTGPLRVVTAYFPNGGEVRSDKYAYKLRWMERFRAWLARRERPDQRLVLLGDLNVAPTDLDVWDPAVWEGETLFTPAEKEALAAITAWGLHDALRKHHPEGGIYTYWDYRGLALLKNQGLRIDHVLVTAPLLEACSACDVDREARKGRDASDHAPVIATFEI